MWQEFLLYVGLFPGTPWPHYSRVNQFGWVNTGLLGARGGVWVLLCSEYTYGHNNYDDR